MIVLSRIRQLSRGCLRIRWSLCTCPTNPHDWKLCNDFEPILLNDNFGGLPFVGFSIIAVALVHIIEHGRSVVGQTHVRFIQHQSLKLYSKIAWKKCLRGHESIISASLQVLASSWRREKVCSFVTWDLWYKDSNWTKWWRFYHVDWPCKGSLKVEHSSDEPMDIG